MQAFKKHISDCLFRLHYGTAVPDHCRHCLSAVAPHQDLALSSLGSSQNGQITLLPMVLLKLVSPLPHLSHPMAGLSITPQHSGYRKPGVPSAHPLASTKPQWRSGKHPASTTQHRSAETRCNIGFPVHYQSEGCHAMFGLYPFFMY